MLDAPWFATGRRDGTVGGYLHPGSRPDRGRVRQRNL